VTPAELEALALARGYAAAGRIVVTGHAVARMRQRGAGYADVRNALSKARECRADETRWKMTGPDLDGDDLTCIVAFAGGVVVVTLF